MAIQCITSTRFTMQADVLRNDANGDSQVPLSEQGTHEVRQNPRTGEVERVWVPVVDDTAGASKPHSVTCEVRGILEGGIRVAGTTERMSERYENIDLVFMTYPAGIILTKRDRITNVRTKKTQHIIWVEEELNADDGIYPATVFDVLGVTPITNPFGTHIENRAMLARVDIDEYGS